MPVKKCKGGHKYGKTGKCYKGKSSKSRASKQGRAIKASQGKKRYARK